VSSATAGRGGGGAERDRLDAGVVPERLADLVDVRDLGRPRDELE
jgi:hypothetical protein